MFFFFDGSALYVFLPRLQRIFPVATIWIQESGVRPTDCRPIHSGNIFWLFGKKSKLQWKHALEKQDKKQRKETTSNGFGFSVREN